MLGYLLINQHFTDAPVQKSSTITLRNRQAPIDDVTFVVGLELQDVSFRRGVDYRQRNLRAVRIDQNDDSLDLVPRRRDIHSDGRFSGDLAYTSPPAPIKS